MPETNWLASIPSSQSKVMREGLLLFASSEDSRLMRHRNAVKATKRLGFGASVGQSVVEAALAFTLLVTLFTGVVSLGELINYNIGLDNAVATAATAASEAADVTNGNPSSSAVSAVNQEQGVSSWTACGSPIVAPCVSVSQTTQTSGSYSVKVEQVTLHGSFSPMFKLLGVTLPVTVTASAST